MTKVIIKGKKYNAFEVYKTKNEAFTRKKNIANNSAVYLTDNGTFAIFLKTRDVSNLY